MKGEQDRPIKRAVLNKEKEKQRLHVKVNNLLKSLGFLPRNRSQRQSANDSINVDKIITYFFNFFFFNPFHFHS